MPDYLYTLICDGVRPEPNNKLTVLGLLGDEVYISQMPSTLPSFAFVQKWKPSEGDTPGRQFAFSFEIRSPGAATPVMVQAQTVTTPAAGRHPSINIMIQIQGFPVPAEGEYELRTLIDGEVRHRHTFFIGLVPPGTQPLG